MGRIGCFALAMSFYDAHCHLQDDRLALHRVEILGLYGRLGVAEVAVNGTSPADWRLVAELARESELVRPSFGLHPWKVREVDASWRSELLELLGLFPDAGVGEIGLDRWVEGFDLSVQEPVFLWQLEQAVERELPVSVHCLRAWGRMYDLLRASPRPKRGFLLHSYGGPAEMVEAMARLGAYFSVSGYFSHDRKLRQREALRAVPLDRLLIETDAPDMKGPSSSMTYSFNGDEMLNHPANIVEVYRFAAGLFGLPLEEMREQVAANYERFFGGKR